MQVWVFINAGRYAYSTNWLQEFDDPTLAGKLYTGDFPLVDVTVIPDEEIMGHRSMAALTLLQKHIRQRVLAELTDRLSAILLAGYLSSPQVISLIHYIIQADGHVQTQWRGGVAALHHRTYPGLAGEPCTRSRWLKNRKPQKVRGTPAISDAT